MKILIAVPRSRSIEAVEQSWQTLDYAGHEVDWLMISGEDDPARHPYENITRKSYYARALALQGGYDALLLLDDDQIVPSDTIPRLIAAGGDVAYGLTVWRNVPHSWSALSHLAHETDMITGDCDDTVRAQWWGNVVDVQGCGTFCTLIKRHVLEALPFERRGAHCFDFYLSQDCIKHGFRQRCDLGLIVGHVTDNGVLWPTAIGYELRVH